MQVDRKHEHAERQHPEAEDGKKSKDPAQDKRKTSQYPHHWRARHMYLSATESYCRHEILLAGKCSPDIGRCPFGR